MEDILWSSYVNPLWLFTFPEVLLCFGLFSDASFSESLYGLRRRAVKFKLKKDALHHADSTDGVQHSGIEYHQRVLSVVFLVYF